MSIARSVLLARFLLQPQVLLKCNLGVSVAFEQQERFLQQCVRQHLRSPATCGKIATERVLQKKKESTEKQKERKMVSGEPVGQVPQ